MHNYWLLPEILLPVGPLAEFIMPTVDADNPPFEVTLFLIILKKLSSESSVPLILDNNKDFNNL